MRTMWSIFTILTVNFVPLLLFSSFLLIYYVCLYVWKNRDFYKKINKFHSLPTIPLLGNALPFLLSRKNRLDTIIDVVAQYEKRRPFVFWLSYIPIVMVTTYEDIQIVSNKSLWRNALGKFRKLGGDGIMWSHPDKWRNIRRAVNPAFGPTMLQQYLIIFNKHTKNMVHKLKDVSDNGKIIDIFPFINNNTFNIITENMFGVDLEAEEECSYQFSYSLNTSMGLEISRFFELWKFPDFTYHLYLLFSGQKDLFKNLYKMPTEVIQKKITEYRHNKEKLKISNGGSIVDRPVKTYVDILVQLHHTFPEFTKQQIHDELITVVSAGSDSPVTVVSFTLLMLAMNPEVQEKLYQEIVEIFGNDSSKIEIKLEDLMSQKLEYLDRCIKETLRKYTIVPLVPRITTEEVVLSDGNVIPTGTFVVMMYYNLHHDPNIFPNPEKWDPENFAEESVKPYFMPFGIGPKYCIASKYAVILIKTQIIHILHQYHFSTNIGPDDINLVYHISLKNKGEYPVTVTQRKNNKK